MIVHNQASIACQVNFENVNDYVRAECDNVDKSNARCQTNR